MHPRAHSIFVHPKGNSVEQEKNVQSAFPEDLKIAMKCGFHPATQGGQGEMPCDAAGHGVFMEEGAETGNTVTGNLVFGSLPGSGKLLASDTMPSSYWFINVNNTFTGNVAAGSQVTASLFTQIFSPLFKILHGWVLIMYAHPRFTHNPAGFCALHVDSHCWQFLNSMAFVGG